MGESGGDRNEVYSCVGILRVDSYMRAAGFLITGWERRVMRAIPMVERITKKETTDERKTIYAKEDSLDRMLRGGTVDDRDWGRGRRDTEE